MLLRNESGAVGGVDESVSTNGLLGAVKPRELAGAFLLLTAAMLAPLAASHGFSLFSKHFWNDEWVTHLIASDPDLKRAAWALWTGLDNNPPTLYLLLRAIGMIFGSSEMTYHWFTFGSVFLGLLGLYLTLRQAFSPVVTWTAVLAVWAHPLILRHAFDARSYGPLFCLSVWFAYLLQRTGRPSRGVWVDVLGGFTAVLLCTMHYFGVICMSLILAVELLRRRGTGTSLHVWAAAGAGFLSVAACIPLVLAQNRSHIGSYLPSPTPGLISDYVTELLLPAHLAAIAVIPGLAYAARVIGIPMSRPEQESEGRLMSVAGVSSLLLYPAILIVFSFVVQGALLVRYAPPALAGLAPGVALVTNRLSRVWLGLLCAFFLLSGTRTLKHMAEDRQDMERQTAELIDVIRRDTGSAPVTFEIHLPYDIVYYAPDIANRVYFLGADTPFYKSQEVNTPYFSEGEAATKWERDWAQRYEELYGKPAVMPWEKLKRLPRKFIVVGTDPMAAFQPRLQQYPGFTLRQVERSLYELVEKTD